MTKEPKEQVVGSKADFAIGYRFFDGVHIYYRENVTELAMYIGGTNILAFAKDGEEKTTRWNLDDLVEWLGNFVNNLHDDPYPVDAPGEYAAIKDSNARDFDTDDEDEFNRYYETINDWCWRHEWIHERAGGILANVLFQQVGDRVEISWDNRDIAEGVKFRSLLGGARVTKAVFMSVVRGFIRAYLDHWYPV